MDTPSEIEFTRYALRRMEQRRVPREAVAYVLANYVQRIPAQPRRGARPAEIYSAEYHGRWLKVWVERDRDPLLIKTVAWRDE